MGKPIFPAVGIIAAILVVVFAITISLSDGTTPSVKVGKEYVLIMGTTIAFDKDVAQRLHLASGTEMFRTIANNNETQRAGIGVSVLVTGKDGGVCEITDGTTVGYVYCEDSFVGTYGH